MNISNVCLLFYLAVSAQDAKTDFSLLTQQLAPSVQWIDNSGSIISSKEVVRRKLIRIVKNLHNPGFITKHQSDWKNNQAYQIIHVEGKDITFRIFFHYVRNHDDKRLVTRVKVNQL